MYTYYKKVVDEEHMLFGTEIAEAFGIMSENTKPHATFVKAYLNYFINKNIKNHEQYYYITNNKYKGAIVEVEVYPKWIYLRAMHELYNMLEETNTIYKVTIDNKKYNVKRVEV